MTDNDEKNHWNSLAEQLGAEAPREPQAARISDDSAGAAPPDSPPISQTPAPAPAKPERTSQSPRPKADWNALANQFGIELPPEPEPAAPESSADDAAEADIEPERTPFDTVPPVREVSTWDRLEQVSPVEILDAEAIDEHEWAEAPDEDESSTDEGFVVNYAVSMDEEVVLEEDVIDFGSDESVTDEIGELADDSDADEDEDRPRRRRRRRRRRGGRRSDSPSDQSARDESAESVDTDDSDLDDLDESDLPMTSSDMESEDEQAASSSDEQSERRGRRRRRRRRGQRPDKGAGDEPRGEDDRGSSREESRGDDSDSDDEEGDDQESSARDKHRKIPSWQQAMAMIVDANIASRKEAPSRARGGRNRGGRQRGRGKRD